MVLSRVFLLAVHEHRCDAQIAGLCRGQRDLAPPIFGTVEFCSKDQKSLLGDGARTADEVGYAVHACLRNPSVLQTLPRQVAQILIY